MKSLEWGCSYLFGCGLKHSGLVKVFEVFNGVDILDLSLSSDVIGRDTAKWLDPLFDDDKTGTYSTLVSAFPRTLIREPSSGLAFGRGS